MNLFEHVPSQLPAELTEVLLQNQNVRIERIVSTGHCSPVDFWYDQSEQEWVVLLRGAARLAIAGRGTSIELLPGDHVHIPAHQKHRVEWTSPTEPTVWLAVFYSD
ncbi:cupin domain-containing protein [Stieleria varia]|uniref:Cupin domain protein n=1 Tax=Stieleria varia TaxID=2528005 RepID=A0A5C6ARW0_9BACT|nr:cupin domain-containing protein [Stieleria varia]TWU02241.1 Cupin domain protein [Stieleria varia]